MLRGQHYLTCAGATYSVGSSFDETLSVVIDRGPDPVEDLTELRKVYSIKMRAHNTIGKKFSRSILSTKRRFL